MPKPAAKQGDTVVGVDTHIQLVPSPAGPIPTPLPTPFNGVLTSQLSPDVLIENRPAAIEGSVAENVPPHLPSAGPFLKAPDNKARVKQGSGKVLINRKPAAHAGSPATTCNDPVDQDQGAVVATGTVLIGE
ncbi:MAG: PAAR domain-containing protein [Polyangiaceae bacterium]